MQPTQMSGVRAESSSAPDALECAIQSGQLADQLVEKATFHGSGDLVFALLQVAAEASSSSDAFGRTAGRRAAGAIHRRLDEILRRDWHIESAADLPWEQFTRLLSQASERMGLGSLDCRIDEAAALISVTAWNSPFPQLFSVSGPCCSVLEGFVSEWLGAVAGGDLATLETACRADGALACRIAVGSPAAIEKVARTPA